VYDARMPGGSAVLAVNASRELVPRRPTVSAIQAPDIASVGARTSLRDAWWVWLAAILLLCTEWLLRRRAGLR
jgi:hypothetical protein